MRFLKDDLLQVRHAGNSVSYVDLRNGRCYSCPPRVLRYGSIELLQVNRTYYSRTRQVYANDMRVAFFVHGVDGVLC